MDIKDIITKKKDEKPLENKDISDNNHKTITKQSQNHKFIIISTYGEILDLAIHLEKVEKYESLFHVINDDFKKIGDGIVTKEDNWHFTGYSRCYWQIGRSRKKHL